jgi:hypothetical protein
MASQRNASRREKRSLRGSDGGAPTPTGKPFPHVETKGKRKRTRRERKRARKATG